MEGRSRRLPGGVLGSMGGFWHDRRRFRDRLGRGNAVGHSVVLRVKFEPEMEPPSAPVRRASCPDRPQAVCRIGPLPALRKPRGTNVFGTTTQSSAGHSDCTVGREPNASVTSLQGLSAIACRFRIRLAAYRRAPTRFVPCEPCGFQTPDSSLQESSQWSFSWNPAPSWLV